MSYNKDYRNIIGQYDGSTISERTGIQIRQGLGIGTVNLTNGSSTGTVNGITITNTAGTSIGINTNKFNIDNGYYEGFIGVIDTLTGDIYNLKIDYVTSTSFIIATSGCRKLSYSTETTSSSSTFSGPTGTYEYYIGGLSLCKNNSISIGSGGGITTGINSIALGGGITSGTNSLVIRNGTASGDSSIVLGGGIASGTNSIVIRNGTASGTNSIVIRNGTTSGDSSTVLGGYNNSIYAIYSQGQGSTVLGLSHNSGSILGIMSTGDKYSSILGGNDNYIGVNGNTTANSTYNTSIIGSQACAIYQSSTTDTSLMIYNGIYSSNNSYIRSLATASNLRTCNIIGAENSNITNNTGAQVTNNCLLNTNNVTLQNTNNTTVIGQTSTTTITESDIVYIGKEIVGGKVATAVLSAALSNTSSTIYNNIISFNAKAGATYIIKFVGTYQTAATTTGIKVRMSGTAVANVTGYMAGEITAATGATGLKATIASMTSELITTGVSAINTPHAIDGDIIVRCTTAGTVILQMASEVNGSAAQLNIGTAVIVERVI